MIAHPNIIVGEDFTSLYPSLLAEVDSNGEKVLTRNKWVREMENVQMKIENPRKSIVMQQARKFNLAYAVIEMLSLFMPGEAVRDALLFYNSNMKNYLNPNTGLFDGSYAERLTMYDQLRYCRDVLIEDIHSRRAVLDFYNAAYDQHESLDICCTLNMLFRVRNGKLNATVFMRGNDVLWGTPYNFVMFTWLQNVMLKWLQAKYPGLKMGNYTHIVGSAHYYLDKRDEIEAVLDNPFELKDMPITELPEWDIEGVEETFQEIDKFFQTEAAYRRYSMSGDADELKGASPFKSKALYDLFEQVIKPAVIRKAIKLSGN